MAQDIDRTDTRRQITLAPNSWLNHCEEEYVYDAETGKYIRFFNIFEAPSLEGVESTERTIIVQNKMRIDTIASEFYEDELLSWVIAYRNKLDLPAQQLTRGMKLKIPSPDFVRRRLVSSS